MRPDDLPTRDSEHAGWLIQHGHMSDALLVELLEPTSAVTLSERGGLVGYLLHCRAIPDSVVAQIPTEGATPGVEVTSRDRGFGPPGCNTVTAVEPPPGPIDTGATDTIAGGGGPRVDPDLRMIGRYIVAEVIGKGGMGVVYRAEDPGLKRTVALKVLGAAERDDKESLDRFFREARTAGSLRHPGIIAVHEVGVFENTPFVAMDFIDGPALWELIQARTYDEWTVRDRLVLFRDVARAVQHAHEHGIVHRDLKTSNVMVDQTGKPVVLDFGLARHIDGSSRLTMTGAFLGTPGYMPPEQLGGEPEKIGAHTDVFALGVILYELLCGKLPFRGDSPAATIAITLVGHYPTLRMVNPRIHPDLETVCAKCLEGDFGRRYPNAGALAEDIDRFLANEPIAAKPAGRLRRVAKWLQRRRGLAAGAGVAAAFLLALAIFATWNWTRPAVLRLRVKPAGATVAVGGRSFVVSGESFTVEVAPGDHTLRAELTGYLPLLREERGLARNETREIVLELARETGTLVIDAFPPQGVEVDPVAGAVPYMNLKTRKIELRLPTGRHEVAVGREGHYRERIAVDVRRDQTVERRVTFRKALVWRITALDWGGARATGDLDGDSVPDLVTRSFQEVLVLSGRTGELRLKEAVPAPGNSFGGSIDLDGDGALDWVTCRITSEGRPELAAFSLVRTDRLKPLWTAPADGVLTVRRYREARGGSPGFFQAGLGLAEADPPPGVPAAGDPARGPGGYADGFLVRAEGDFDGDGAPDLLGLCEGGELRAWSGRTGAKLWTRALPEPAWRISFGSPPLLLVMSDRRLLALEARTGAVAWEVPLESPTWLGPWHEGGRIAIAVGGDLRAYDTATGRETARMPWTPRPDPERPTRTWGGLLLQEDASGKVNAWSRTDGKLAWSRACEIAPGEAGAVDLDGNGTYEMVGRDRTGKHLIALDAGDGRLRWSFPAGAASWTELRDLAPDCQHALVVAEPTRLDLLDPATGKALWSLDLPAPLTAQRHGVDYDANGVQELYVGTQGGHFLAISAAGKELFSAQLDKPVLEIDATHVDWDGLRDFVLRLPDGSVAIRAPKVIWRRQLDRQVRAQPVLHDVNGDGIQDAILPILDSGNEWPVLALDGRDGSTLWEERHPLDMARPVAVADLDGDGRAEVITWHKDAHSLRLLDATTGAKVADVEVPAFGYADPAIGDLDGDGAPDVVALGWYEEGAYAAISGKTRKTLWQGRAQLPSWSAATIADVDGDGAPEVFFVTLIGSVFALRGRTGEVLWREELQDRQAGTRAGVGLVRFSAEEGFTVVVSAGDHTLRLFDARTGKAGQVIADAGGTASRPAFADVDGDGVPEILVGGAEGLACVNRKGERLWLCRMGMVSGDPVLADLDGDGTREVVAGNLGGLVYCLELATGRTRWAWSAAPDDAPPPGAGPSQPRDYIEGTVSIADFDGDGALDVLVPSHNGSVTCIRGRGNLAR